MKWTTAYILVMLMPGATCTMAELSTVNPDTKTWNWKRAGRIIMTFFFYPIWVVVL